MTTQQDHGGLDTLVNNAVVRSFGTVENFAPEQWDEALAVNLSAPFHAIRLALPGVKAKNWGRIINMASIYSTFATVNRIDYITTKTALVGLTQAVALKVARTGDDVQRDLSRNRIDAGDRLAVAAGNAARRHQLRRSRGEFPPTRQPLRKFVKEKNVAGLIAFLCGPHAEDINASAMPIDGAWKAGR